MGISVLLLTKIAKMKRDQASNRTWGLASKAWPTLWLPLLLALKTLLGQETLCSACPPALRVRCGAHSHILEGSLAHHVYLLLLSEFQVIEKYPREMTGKAQ